MKEKHIVVQEIPTVLYGDSSESVFLYIHGKMGCKEEAAHFAEIVCPKGYQVLSIDLPGHGERTGEMERFVPWEVVPELQAVYGSAQQRWKKISLYANSIGAYFSLLAFREAGIELEFRGSGIDEKGYDRATGRVVVEVSPDFYRPTDVVNLWGDPSKAKRELGWNPAKTSFLELVQLMVRHDMEKVAVERAGERVRTNLAEYLEKGVVK